MLWWGRTFAVLLPGAQRAPLLEGGNAALERRSRPTGPASGVSTFPPETVRRGRLCRLTCEKALPFRTGTMLLLYLPAEATPRRSCGHGHNQQGKPLPLRHHRSPQSPSRVSGRRPEAHCLPCAGRSASFRRLHPFRLRHHARTPSCPCRRNPKGVRHLAFPQWGFSATA